jgi:hypothetical protein
MVLVLVVSSILISALVLLAGGTVYIASRLPWMS